MLVGIVYTQLLYRGVSRWFAKKKSTAEKGMAADGVLVGAISFALFAGVIGGLVGGLLAAIVSALLGGILGGAIGITTFDYFARCWKKIIASDVHNAGMTPSTPSAIH